MVFDCFLAVRQSGVARSRLDVVLFVDNRKKAVYLVRCYDQLIRSSNNLDAGCGITQM